MKSKKIDSGSKDIISNLPEPLICHILSFLPIEESALTSVLSKKWRYLFAFTPNLDFECSLNLHPALSIDDVRARALRSLRSDFRDFVDRVLSLQGNSTLNKFSLNCGHCLDSVYVTDWLLNVLERGVSDLYLRVSVDQGSVTSKVFVSKSLVKLRIESGNVSVIDVAEDVFLPKLKTLYLDKVMLGKADDCFDKVTSGCHVLEELVLKNVYSDVWNRSVSSNTLKRLTLWCVEYDRNPDSVSFDTPNLIFLKYSDYVAVKYPKVRFGPLFEADIDIAMTTNQSALASYGELVGNTTDFFKGICNVQFLSLSANTLEVLTFCCESIPVFKNLIQLTIKSEKVGWESLPDLLKKCPNLEALIFDGLHHKYTIKCGDVDGCLCKFSGEIPSCLSSSPVKVLKIMRFGENDDKENQIELIKYFIETMPCLELVIVYYDTSSDDDLMKVSSQLENLPRAASPNCKIRVISYNQVNQDSSLLL